MPVYLAPYRGKGVRKDPYRPVGSEQDGWAAIDLRADGSRKDGGGQPYAILYLPEGVRDRRLKQIADSRGDKISKRALSRLQDILHLQDLPPYLPHMVARSLARPPRNGWNYLRPTGFAYEVHLGGLLCSWPFMRGGASATDNFTRANETPLASPWVKSGAGPNVNLVSNKVQVASDGDTFYYYTGGATSADQYSQASVTYGAGTPDCGPAVRILGSAITGYFHDSSGAPGSVLLKHISGSASVVQAYASVAFLDNDVNRIECQGSTIRAYQNAVLLTPAGSDTSITGAGAGTGLFFFSSTCQQFAWSGGDIVTGQTVLPDADNAAGGWTTTPLFSKVNDASDATVITGTAA